MIARYEGEFTGRILRDAGDVARWRSSPADGLCWGVIGVAGLDFLVRKPDDLDRLPALFERGVRVFQPVATSEGLLAGSADPGDDRGLTELGRALLTRLAELTSTGEPGPRPILDLAGMNTQSIDETLRHLDDEPSPRRKWLVALSHGTLSYRDLLDPSSPESRTLAELRARGGVIGLTPGLPGCETLEELKHLVDRIAILPFEGRPGYEGIAIGGDLLGSERTTPALFSARDLTRSLGRAFDRDPAAAIASGNAERLLLRSAGIDAQEGESGA
jgi:membrane dipeptidase